MAQLIYDETGRLLFTQEMKEEYTLLIPQMLPIHFGMFKKCLDLEGFHTAQLNNDTRTVVETGLKYVHNDTCYPALLVIGQLIDAVQSGQFDPHKVALLITQTGGGCRASNYIHLLRKALVKAGLEFVPVVSLNLSGLEKNPGFQLSFKLLRRLIYAVYYGDMLMWLANQCKPYEVVPGTTDALVEQWKDRLVNGFDERGSMRRATFRKNLAAIAADFAAIEQTGEKKIPVGIVGEIFVKYSSLGNNNLEEFLLSEGAEPVVPGLADFLIFKVDNRSVDVDLYGGKMIKKLAMNVAEKYAGSLQHDLIHALARHPQFRVMKPFSHLKEGVKGYLGYGNKMGEGWLLTAEMLDLIELGVPNIVCAQPFGCLPNHVAGKGMIRKIKDDHPGANIVAIDYDPSATRINQENRIKLMLANAQRTQQTATESGREAAQKAPREPAIV